MKSGIVTRHLAYFLQLATMLVVGSGPALSAPHSDTAPTIDACQPPATHQIAHFMPCTDGGGIYGHWLLDRFDLPAFEYTLPHLRDTRAIWTHSEQLQGINRERRDHFLMQGNQRLNFKATNDGYVELFTNERAPAWLNTFDEKNQQYAGGFSYVLHQGETFASNYRFAPPQANVRRQFGIGYFLQETHYKNLLLRHWIYAPYGNNPFIIDDVELINTGIENIDIDHVEYWDVNRLQLITQWVATGYAAPLVRRYRKKFNADFVQSTYALKNGADTLVASQHATPQALPPPAEQPHQKDWYPDDTFLMNLSEIPADQAFTDQTQFFAQGNPPDIAQLKQQQTIDLENASATPQTAMLAQRHALPLRPGEKNGVHLRFAYGYLTPDFSPEKVAQFSISQQPQLLEQHIEKWRKQLVYATEPQFAALQREAAWRSYQLQANTVYNRFYNLHYTPQGSAYLYLHGADGVPRDQALFSTATVYLDPTLAKDNIRMMMNVTNSETGAITYSFTGFGMLDNALGLHKKPSDLDVFLLFALSEYLSVTGDYDFLQESVPFHDEIRIPFTAPQNTTVLDHVRKALDHLQHTVGVGPHGLLRIGDGDWDDGIVLEDPSPLAIYFTQQQGESVPNSQMALTVFPTLARQLVSVDPVLSDRLFAFSEKLQAPVKNTFGSRWFGRAYMRNTFNMSYLKGNDKRFDLFKANYIDLQAQPWGMLSNVLTPEQRERLLNEVENRLDAPSPIGPMMRPANQSVWPAVSQLMTWAYARYRPEAAWRSVMEHSGYQNGMQFPEIWYGKLSGPDGITARENTGGNSTQSGARAGETWASPVTPMTDFPVANMNQEAMYLFGLMKTAGVDTDAEGLVITPSAARKEYRVESPLLGLWVTPEQVRFRYNAFSEVTQHFRFNVADGRQAVVYRNGMMIESRLAASDYIFDVELAEGDTLTVEIERFNKTTPGARQKRNTPLRLYPH